MYQIQYIYIIHIYNLAIIHMHKEQKLVWKS